MEKVWKSLQFLAACAVAIAAYVFVPWSKLDSGWSQAIGSFAALGVAIYVMAKQNKHSAQLLIQADLLATKRRAAGVSAIIQRAAAQSRTVDLEVRRAIQEFTDTETLAYRLRVTHGVISPMRAAVLAIPTYELGSLELAESVHQMGEALTNLDLILERAAAHPGGFERDPSVIEALDLVVQIIRTSEANFAHGLVTLK